MPLEFWLGTQIKPASSSGAVCEYHWGKDNPDLRPKVFSELLVGDESVVGSCHLDSVLHVDPPVVDAECPLDVVDAGHEEVTHLELGRLLLEPLLDDAVGVVDDGQEHVEQDEEDEEDVDEEVDGAEQRRGALDVPEVEVAEDHAEQGEDGVRERAKVVHLSVIQSGRDGTIESEQRQFPTELIFA